MFWDYGVDWVKMGWVWGEVRVSSGSARGKLKVNQCTLHINLGWFCEIGLRMGQGWGEDGVRMGQIHLGKENKIH